MTYGELTAKMSAAEFELWIGLAMLKQDECPSCGVDPRDLGSAFIRKYRCPTCKEQVHKVERFKDGQFAVSD